MAKETATITFESEDGRKFTSVATRDTEKNEVLFTTDFGKGGPEAHAEGLHGQIFVNLMKAMEKFSK